MWRGGFRREVPRKVFGKGSSSFFCRQTEFFWRLLESGEWLVRDQELALCSSPFPPLRMVSEPFLAS